MKHLTTIRENGWHWPNNCDYTWTVVTGALDLIDNVMPYVKQANVAIQAGGNGGLMVQPLAERFKNVYTFEPDPLNFYCLVHNITSTNVNKFQACLGNNRALVKLDTHYASDNGAFFVNGQGSIPTFRIDDLGLTECDLIQLDIEGHEYFALLGGLETIKKNKPVIVMECFEPWMTRYNISQSMIDNLLIGELNYTYIKTHNGDKIYVFNS